jgi:hypothetical protein
MYTPTQSQLDAEKRLSKQGFRFHNWIAHRPDADGEPSDGTEQLGTMIMVRRPNRFTREYREIEPDGSIL